MAEKAVVWEPLETDPLLLAMALDRAGLVQAARFAEHERSFVTVNDPIGFASYVAYAKSGRSLREWYMPKGWLRDNSNNQVAIKHPGKMIRVVPCNFNEFAGDPFHTPTNKAPKGEISRKKSESNLVTWLPGLEPPVIDPNLNDGYQTWLLGMYFDDIRPLGAELSLPIEFDGKQFKKFGQRIVLIWGGDDGGGSAGRKRTDGDGGDDAVGIVDIAIKRK